MKNSNYVYFAMHDGSNDVAFPFCQKLLELAGLEQVSQPLDKLDQNQDEEWNFTPYTWTKWWNSRRLPDNKAVTLFSDVYYVGIIHGKVEISEGRCRNDMGELIENCKIIATFEPEDIMNEYQKKLDLNLNYEILCLNLMPPYDFFEFKL